MSKTALWFRRDLRAEDNPILAHDGCNVLPIFIFDKNILEKLSVNDDRMEHIFNLVINLKNSLKRKNLDLAIFFAKPEEVFIYLRGFGIDSAVISQDYDKYSIERDLAISKLVKLTTVKDNFFLDYDLIKNSQQQPFKIFTPFYKNTYRYMQTTANIYYNINNNNKLISFDYDNIIEIDNSSIIKKPISIESIFFRKSLYKSTLLTSPVDYLIDRLKIFISNYHRDRDFPDIESVSMIGFHLRFGSVSIREILRRLQDLSNSGYNTESFTKQLFWREFFCYILYNYPKSEFDNFQKINVQWEYNQSKFEKWKNGETGVPIVDAGMRELLVRGYMHNRVRMICSAFLVKDLHIDWREGEKYFASKLLDYEASSNIGSWQWSASTGTDAQPYFRIFNPYLQSKKFDSDCAYIKKYVEELKYVSPNIIHSEDKLISSNIKNYNKPIIIHRHEAEKSIKYFKSARIV